MSSTCYIHKGKFANDGVCPKCKSCKHEKWSLINGVYFCHNCPKKQTTEPKAEIWEMVEGGWEQRGLQ